MANCCFCDFFFEFETEENKNLFFNRLNEIIEEANSNEIGAFVGTDKRYLFDGECFDNSSTSVIINCWVKWALEQTEMKSMLDFFLKIVPIKKMIVDYEECGESILGKYIYENGVLTDTYLTPQKIWEIYNSHPCSLEENEDDCDMKDDYYDKLRLELNNNPTIKIIN